MNVLDNILDGILARFTSNVYYDTASKINSTSDTENYKTPFVGLLCGNLDGEELAKGTVYKHRLEIQIFGKVHISKDDDLSSKSNEFICNVLQDLNQTQWLTFRTDLNDSIIWIGLNEFKPAVLNKENETAYIEGSFYVYFNNSFSDYTNI